MAKADKSIDPRILESAKEEFLQKGFLNASLQEICKNAGVTTGALYKRFSGKEELFCTLVEDTIKDLEQTYEMKAAQLETLSDEELKRAWEMDEDYMLWWFRFLFDRYDGMRLLLTCSEGTKYSNFEHDWVEKMCRATYAYYLEARRRKLTAKDVSERELHVTLSAFWMTIYEPLVHAFSWQEVENLCKLICRLFDWYGMLGFER